jgi:hypothetical protein
MLNRVVCLCERYPTSVEAAQLRVGETDLFDVDAVVLCLDHIGIAVEIAEWTLARQMAVTSLQATEVVASAVVLAASHAIVVQDAPLAEGLHL